CENEARALAAREAPHRLVRVVAREEDVAELAADEADRLAGGGLPEPGLHRLLPAARELAVILREVAGVRLVAPGDAARVRRELADRDLEKSRLADSVRADDGETVASLDLERDIAQHLVLAVGLVDAFHLEGLAAARALLAE